MSVTHHFIMQNMRKCWGHLKWYCKISWDYFCVSANSWRFPQIVWWQKEVYKDILLLQNSLDRSQVFFNSTIRTSTFNITMNPCPPAQALTLFAPQLKLVFSKGSQRKRERDAVLKRSVPIVTLQATLHPLSDRRPL